MLLKLIEVHSPNGELIIGNGEQRIWNNEGGIEMSYQHFEKAMSMAPKCHFFMTAGGRTHEEILRSEELLGINFSKQCLEFYKQHGYLSFYGNEIFGVDPTGDSGILAGNSVAYALNDRKEYNLPKEWIPLYDYSDGFMAYLDYSHLNSENEPSVIVAIYTGNGYEISETIAEDFGDFLLQLVQQQLESQ